MVDSKFYATGKRKTSIARVWLTPGTGQITINKHYCQYRDNTTGAQTIGNRNHDSRHPSTSGPNSSRYAMHPNEPSH